jgi:hypothetical protein
MVTGLGFLTVVTASISAMFIESARRRVRRHDDDRLHEIAARLEGIERRGSTSSRDPSGEGHEPLGHGNVRGGAVVPTWQVWRPW